MQVKMTTLPTLGQVIVAKRTFTQENFNLFAELSHDDNPIHVDPVFAATTRFGGTVAHGMMLYGMILGVLSENFSNVRQLEQDLIFPKPTYANMEVTLRLEVTEVQDKRARLSTTITRPDGENSCEGSMLIEWK
jgi:acyl dehydratase